MSGGGGGGGFISSSGGGGLAFVNNTPSLNPGCFTRKATIHIV